LDFAQKSNFATEPFICHECHKTFSATTGTVFYRLRTAADTVITIVTLLAHGCPVQAIVAAFGFDERTVAAWWARAGHQGQAVHESLVEESREMLGIMPQQASPLPEGPCPDTNAER
jgi:transposase-like protein